MKMPTHGVRFTALAAVIQPFWFLGGSVLFGSWRAGYSPTHAISELGEQGGSNALAWNLFGFGGSAVLYLIYVVAILACFGRGWLAWLIVAQGLAIGASGIFSCDPGCPGLMVTPEGWGHTIAGLSYFALVVTLPLVAWPKFRGLAEWRSLAWPSAVVGICLVGLFVVGPLFGQGGIGIWQRTVLVIAYSWAIVVALRVYRHLAHREAPSALQTMAQHS